MATEIHFFFHSHYFYFLIFSFSCSCSSSGPRSHRTIMSSGYLRFPFYTIFVRWCAPPCTAFKTMIKLIWTWTRACWVLPLNWCETYQVANEDTNDMEVYSVIRHPSADDRIKQICFNPLHYSYPLIHLRFRVWKPGASRLSNRSIVISWPKTNKSRIVIAQSDWI